MYVMFSTLYVVIASICGWPNCCYHPLKYTLWLRTVLFGLERLHSEHRCSALSVCSALNRTNYLGQSEAGEERPLPFCDYLTFSKRVEQKRASRGRREARWRPFIYPSTPPSALPCLPSGTVKLKVETRSTRLSIIIRIKSVAIIFAFSTVKL